MSTLVSMPQGNKTSANPNRVAADFQAQQQQFCAWLRDPTQQPMPADVSPARMHIYRELLYHNVCNFIDMVYPVAQKLVGQAQWQRWQQQFFADYRCSSPFYLDISLHFRDFLQEDGATSDQLARYPWLHELLQYEWLELYLDTMSNSMPNSTPNSMPDYQSHHQSNRQAIAQPAMRAWQLTRPIWVLVYQYPVYDWYTGMSLDDINTVSALPSAIMVWRAADHSVQMRPISALQAIALSALQQQFEQAQAALHTQDLFDICQTQCVDLDAEMVSVAIAELKQQLQDWQLLPV